MFHSMQGLLPLVGCRTESAPPSVTVHMYEVNCVHYACIAFLAAYPRALVSVPGYSMLTLLKRVSARTLQTSLWRVSSHAVLPSNNVALLIGHSLRSLAYSTGGMSADGRLKGNCGASFAMEGASAVASMR